MDIVIKRTLAVMVAVGFVVGASGCTASRQAAQAAYEVCDRPDRKGHDLMQLDGSTVSIVIDGEAARDLGDGYEEVDKVGSTSFDAGKLATMFRYVADVTCMVDETGFPGSWDQLKNGDTWEGWEYREDEGAGNASSAHFTATG